MASVGQTAPDFTLPRDGGGQITLSALRPGKVVVYFYPKDDTTSCTTEAQDFTLHAAAFAATGTTVIGISKDSAASHDKFMKKRGLNIILASDAAHTTCEDYGVWGEKSMYGKTYMGIIRTTVLIDGAGTIVQVWDKVKVKDHAAAVLSAAQAL